MNDKNKNGIAAIYCRVSTYEQAQGNTSSLDGQQDTLIEYCKSKGWDVYKVYRDTKSGKSLERDEIQELLKEAEAKKFDVVVATKLDRLSRSITDFLEFDARLSALGIDIVITTQHIDTTSPAGKMQRNIMLVFAEFEREIISERTREKLYYQAQKGYWGGGHTPLGYDAVDKKLIDNVQEAKIVQRIYQMYLEGISSVEIANILNKEGYRPKERKSKEKIVSDRYTKDSILRILKNKIYLGLITIKTRKSKGKELPVARVEEFKGLHKAIIDQDIFGRVQAKLEISKKNKFTEYSNSPLLLLQKITCGFCGAAMTTSFTSKPGGRKIYSYRCTGKTKKGNKSCECKDVPAKSIEEFIIALMIEIGSTEGMVKAVCEHFRSNTDADIDEKKEKLADLKRNFAKIEAESKATILLAAKDEKLMELSSVTSLLQEHEQKKKTLQHEITSLEDEIKRFTANLNADHQFEDLLTKVPELLKTLGKEERRKLIGIIVNEIKWTVKTGEKEGEIEIFFRGDGRINKKWVNRVNPSDLVSSFLLDWLREQDSNLQPFG